MTKTQHNIFQIFRCDRIRKKFVKHFTTVKLVNGKKLNALVWMVALMKGLNDPPAGESEQLVDWICCDGCSRWSHGICVVVRAGSAPEYWQCFNCAEDWR